ncbi:uncharacterized protein LOC123527833 [Mercenaria mercenaria]|uniref:uncharacterized protein LOC123527833 n=1 Tax=Mercenaria mercenaria TaxID=6596 RepID=UPI00234F8E2B|nr:uncharacterized protein LOC123527833 [Mercenaria mercenaria]XP_053379624.1 uncharacterized protein LOC123527833 [Mercenaria mercenaria]
MPAVRCPVPGCDYITDDLDSTIVVALINAHSASHTGGEAAKVESARRSIATASGSNEDSAVPLTSGTTERSRSQYIQGRCTHRQTCPGICYKYNGNGCEKADSCPYIHMCKSYVESRCTSGKECSKSHDIFNPAVKAKLEKHGINTKRRPREVLADFQSILQDDECGNSKAEKIIKETSKHTAPKICYGYNGNGCGRAGSCSFIHMCRSYVERRCESGKECSKSHDICNPAVKSVLEKHGINTKRRPREILADLQAAVKGYESKSNLDETEITTGPGFPRPSLPRERQRPLPGKSQPCLSIYTPRPAGPQTGKKPPRAKSAQRSADPQAAQRTPRAPSTHRQTATAWKSEEKSQKQKSVKLCYRYNGKGCEKAGSCPYIHMCKSYVARRCITGKECSKSHDILDPAVKSILAKHGINTNRRPREILADLQAAVKAEED